MRILLLMLFIGAASAADTFDDQGRLFIPELRSGDRCFEDMAIQFFPGEDLWSGGYELMYLSEVKCDKEEIEECGNSFGPDCVKFGE